MITPNSTTEMGVTEAEVAAAMKRFRDSVGLNSMVMRGILETFAQSRASAQGGEIAPKEIVYEDECVRSYEYGDGPRLGYKDGWNDCRDEVLRNLATPPATSGMKEGDYMDGVEVDRLASALSWMGAASPESREELAARLPDFINDLTRAVMSHKENFAAVLATPPNAPQDSLVGDAERLDVAAVMGKIPTVARLYYTGLATRRYRRASTMDGPGDPLVHRSHVERELNLIAAIRAGRKG